MGMLFVDELVEGNGSKPESLFLTNILQKHLVVGVLQQKDENYGLYIRRYLGTHLSSNQPYKSYEKPNQVCQAGISEVKDQIKSYKNLQN